MSQHRYISQELLQDPCLRCRSYSILIIRFCGPAQAKRKFWAPETRFVSPCAGKTVRPRSAGARRRNANFELRRRVLCGPAQGKQLPRCFFLWPCAGETQILASGDAFFVALRRRNANFDRRRRIFCPDEVDSRGVRTGWTKSPRRYSETRKKFPGRSLAQAKRKFWPPESRFLWPCAGKTADPRKRHLDLRGFTLTDPYRKNPSVWHTVWGTMRAKKVVYYCTYLHVFIIAIEGPARGYPLRTCFLQFFNRIVIKKTAVLNQFFFWILERFLLLNSFKYN